MTTPSAPPPPPHGQPYYYPPLPPQKRPRWPWLILGPVAFFFVIGLLGGNDNASSTDQRSPAVSSPRSSTPTVNLTPITVDSKKLVSDFDKNKLAANDKYIGKVVRTSGVIKNISNDFTGDYYISLSPNGEKFWGTSIACYFEDKDELTSLENGQSVTLQGTMQEMTLGGLFTRSGRTVVR